VYNGDKLTHFTVSKIDNKISAWGDFQCEGNRAIGY